MTEVIIACFATPKGGMVITENPEIHLHPKAQAELIDFMAKIAKAGVQIIIESHSDHLFNGIRRLISQEKLALSDVAVYNFRQDGNGLTHAEPVEFTPQGGIQSYIPGMFEQFDITEPADMSAVYLGGIFGGMISPKTAVNTGLLPALCEKICYGIGNAAIEGATIMLRSARARATAEHVRTYARLFNAENTADYSRILKESERFARPE